MVKIQEVSEEDATPSSSTQVQEEGLGSTLESGVDTESTMHPAASSNVGASSTLSDAPSGLPFVTTSTVLQSLNQSLKDLEQPGGIAHVELQRRSEDGTTRRATDAERKSVDMEQRLGQAAAYVQSLPTQQARLTWASQQRAAGNALYKDGKYEEAIDVYLTCLVAVAPGSSPTTKEDGPDDPAETTQDDPLLLYYYTMNNLAQSALKLNWYKKAQTFCTLALEKESSSEQPTIQQQMAKLYYKRAKARRLSGDYALAKSDLERALESIVDSNDDDTTAAQMRQVVQQEQALLERAEAEGRRNEQRAQKAMQQAWGGGSKASTSDPTLSTDDDHSTPLFATSGGKRQYSKLRAPSTYTDEPADSPTREAEEEAMRENYGELVHSMGRWYLHMVARVAQRLLDWIGEDEIDRALGPRSEEEPNHRENRSNGKKTD